MKIVHVRRVNVGGKDGKPKRTTFEVFYPAGKGRKHAKEMCDAIEKFIRSKTFACDCAASRILHEKACAARTGPLMPQTPANPSRKAGA